MPKPRRSRSRIVRIEEVEDGVKEITPKSHYDICCDCGLVHNIKIKVHPKDPKKVIMISRREEEMTVKYRAKLGIRIVNEREGK